MKKPKSQNPNPKKIPSSNIQVLHALDLKCLRAIAIARPTNVAAIRKSIRSKGKLTNWPHQTMKVWDLMRAKPNLLPYAWNVEYPWPRNRRSMTRQIRATNSAAKILRCQCGRKFLSLITVRSISYFLEKCNENQECAKRQGQKN
jgi:hypothetical protein